MACMGVYVCDNTVSRSDQEAMMEPTLAVVDWLIRVSMLQRPAALAQHSILPRCLSWTTSFHAQLHLANEIGEVARHANQGRKPLESDACNQDTLRYTHVPKLHEGSQPPYHLALTPTAIDASSSCAEHCPFCAQCFCASFGLLPALSRRRAGAL